MKEWTKLATKIEPEIKKRMNEIVEKKGLKQYHVTNQMIEIFVLAYDNGIDLDDIKEFIHAFDKEKK